jgi:predicted nuclease of predicted toxin-antitoxin system
MRILLDECLPRRLKYDFSGHDAATVPEMGWRSRKNGELMRLARDSFDAFVTMDKGFEHQQNLRGTKLAIILFVASNNRLHTLRPLMPQVLIALTTIQSGEIVKVSA